MEVKGLIKFIGQTENVTDSFKKRDVVITTEEQYPQHILVQFVQDKCDALNGYQIGQQVTVGINLRGKEYQDKNTGQIRYFNTIQGWKIEGQQIQQPQFNQGSQGQPQFNQGQQFQQPQQPQFNQQQPTFNNQGQGGFNY